MRQKRQRKKRKDEQKTGGRSRKVLSFTSLRVRQVERYFLRPSWGLLPVVAEREAAKQTNDDDENSDERKH
jgi:hypothetical protein